MNSTAFVYAASELRDMMREPVKLSGRPAVTHGIRLRGGERALVARKVRVLRMMGCRRPDVAAIVSEYFA